jgi:hypothetical protein
MTEEEKEQHATKLNSIKEEIKAQIDEQDATNSQN